MTTVFEQPHDKQKLDALAERAQHKLLHVTGHFPIDWVPDQVVIDETKVSIIYRSLFHTEIVKTYKIDDIEQVWVESAFLWATLRIFIKGSEDPVLVRGLKRMEAIRARRMIYGLQEAKREGINLNVIEDTDEVSHKVEAIGTIMPVN